jgi:dephospho-CoA kinase
LKPRGRRVRSIAVSSVPEATAPSGLRIGLTGGIGSGKSTVARRLATLGARLVDTDALAHALTAPGGAALPAIVEAFGPHMIGTDGAMDRARMRAHVFALPEERARLERILHPMIGTLTREAAAGAAPGQAVVFDVPLLAESPAWRGRVDRVLVVDCTPETQVARVVQRSGWSEDAVRKAIAQQAPRSRRRAIADAVIFNEGIGLARLEAAVDTLWRAWQAPGETAADGL